MVLNLVVAIVLTPLFEAMGAKPLDATVAADYHAKPSQVMNPNRATKMIRAVQFTSCTAFLPIFSFLSAAHHKGAL